MLGFKDRVGYRSIVYKYVDGEVTDKVVHADEVVDAKLKGWHLSPSQAHPDPDYCDNPCFVDISDQINVDRVRMLNLPMIKNKDALVETSERWLDIKINRKHKLKDIKKRMVKTAMKLGVWEDADGNS